MKKLSLLCAALVALSACRPDDAMKGMDNFKIELNSDVFNYRVHLTVNDENGEPVPYANIKLLGDDAEYLYTEFGTKDFATNSKGEIALAVHPGHEPLEDEPLDFEVLVVSKDYEKGAVPVEVYSGDFDTEASLDLWSLAGLKDKLGIETTPIAASNGAVSNQMFVKKSTMGTTGSNAVQVVSSVTLDSVYYDDNDAAIIIEEGTRFYYYKDIYKQRPIYAKTINEIYDTVDVNGVLVPIRVEEEVVTDTTFEKVYSHRERVAYEGDEIELRSYVGYRNPASYTRKHDPDNDYNMVSMQDNGYYSRAVQKPITKASSVHADFFGTLEDESPVEIYPVDRDDIIYSYVVDENATNPVTGLTIAEGDEVEGRRFAKEAGGEMIFHTERVAVQRAGNGQLRVQGNYRRFGFWEFYPFRYDINIDLAPNLPDSLIPDVENLMFSYHSYLPEQGSTEEAIHIDSWSNQSMTHGNSERRFKAISDNYLEYTIYTEVPMGEPITEVETHYWGERWLDEFVVQGNNVTIDVFRDFWRTADFKPLSTYDVSVVCAQNDSIRLYPTATASSKIGGYPVRVHLKNGKWATRGVEVGDSMGIDIEYRKWSIDTNFVLEQYENVIEYVDETNLDICDI